MSTRVLNSLNRDVYVRTTIPGDRPVLIRSGISVIEDRLIPYLPRGVRTLTPAENARFTDNKDLFSWYPVLAVSRDGERRVLKIVDWVGVSTYVKPEVSVYLTEFGTSSNSAEAIDLRGEEGAPSQGYRGWSPVLAVVPDGVRRVVQVADWVGGEGTKPTAGLYLGLHGYVVRISDAVDIGSDIPTWLLTGVILRELAGLDESLGAVEQIGVTTFRKRPIGVTTAESLLTRADGDTRYAFKSDIPVIDPLPGGGGGGLLIPYNFRRIALDWYPAQTIFEVPDGYKVGALNVLLNGVWLAASDFQATDGRFFHLEGAPQLGDVLEVYATAETLLPGARIVIDRRSIPITDSGLTTFPVPSGYPIGALDILLNGVWIDRSQFVATDGLTFTLVDGTKLVPPTPDISQKEPAHAGDIIEAFISIIDNTFGAVNLLDPRDIAYVPGDYTVNVPGGYTAGQLDLVLNGVWLAPILDYTATNGYSFTLESPVFPGDILEAFVRITVNKDTVLPGSGNGGGGGTIINEIVTEVAVLNRLTLTPIPGESTFLVPGGYPLGGLDVIVNGVILAAADFTANSGTTFTLVVPIENGDTLEVFVRKVGHIDSEAISAQVVVNRFPVPFVAGQVVIPVPGGYTPGGIDIFINGIMLASDDYAANNGLNFTLGNGMEAGDSLEIITRKIGPVGQLADNSISNNKIAKAPARSIKGNNTFTTGNLLDLTIIELVAMIDSARALAGNNSFGPQTIAPGESGHFNIAVPGLLPGDSLFPPAFVDALTGNAVTMHGLIFYSECVAGSTARIWYYNPLPSEVVLDLLLCTVRGQKTLI